MPQRAVKLTSDGATVLVVGAKDVVEVRRSSSADAGRPLGDLEGLKPGERVIVDGPAESDAGPAGDRRKAAPAGVRPPPRAPRSAVDRNPMTPRFFIDRPVFAWVIALGILIAGIIALPRLADRAISVGRAALADDQRDYPGADASTLAQNVTQVIEQELNGIEGSSTCRSHASRTAPRRSNLTFAAGTDVDRAQMDVQKPPAPRRATPARGLPAAGHPGHEANAAS